MRTLLSASLCTAVLAFCVGAGSAQAAPAGLSGDALRGTAGIAQPMAEQATHWRHNWRRCHWVKQTYWHRGHRQTRWVQVCRRWW